MSNGISTKLGIACVAVGIVSIYLAYAGRGTNTYYIFGDMMAFAGVMFIGSYARAKSKIDR